MSLHTRAGWLADARKRAACVLNRLPTISHPQVDAHLSFDTNATYDKAMRLMDLYSKKGIDAK